MYVQAFASTVDATHIGNNVTQYQTRCGVSHIIFRDAESGYVTRHIRTSPYLRWYALALALYVINAWAT
jgi:hypothetical protein